MSKKDSLGDRMKSLYENPYRVTLPGRIPIILRCDGRSFHSYTRSCKKPIDENLVSAMNETMIYLCKNIQGAQIGYCQSDEISILINNYKEINTISWFQNNLQKMVSISAAMASAYFSSLSSSIFNGKYKMALFDSRAFVIPKEEVNNAFLWRQQDAVRNSVQMLARSLYSHKQCENKNISQLQEMCSQKGANWNDCPTSQQRGRCAVKTTTNKDYTNPKTGAITSSVRSEWVIDNEIPIFSHDVNYIEQYI